MHDLPVFLCGIATGLIVAWIALKILQVPIGKKEIAYLRWVRRNSPAWPPAIPPAGGWPASAAPYGSLGRYRGADNKPRSVN